MIFSRLTGLPNFDSSFQLVADSTPSSLGVLASSTAWLAMLSVSPQVHGGLNDSAPAGRLRDVELVLVTVCKRDVTCYTNSV